MQGQEQMRLSHSFGLTQKIDKHVLEHIGKELHINASVAFRKTKQGSYYRLETTARKSLCHIRDYFRGSLLGAKSLEYRIWSRSLKLGHDTPKVCKGAEKLAQIQNQLRKVRRKRDQSY